MRAWWWSYERDQPGHRAIISIGKIAISVLSAYAIVYFRFPFRMFCFWTIFVTLMLPVEVRIIPTFSVMADLNLINTFSGLTIPLIAQRHRHAVLFRQTFLAIPDELMEAARMDGAGPWRFLKDILLPVSAANLAALFVIRSSTGWNQYLWPLLVATDQRADSGWPRHRADDRHGRPATEWNKVMATGVMALIPPVMVVIFMQRWFVKGLGLRERKVHDEWLPLVLEGLRKSFGAVDG